jgi:hypothetical protein
METFEVADSIKSEHFAERCCVDQWITIDMVDRSLILASMLDKRVLLGVILSFEPLRHVPRVVTGRVAPRRITRLSKSPTNVFRRGAILTAGIINRFSHAM